MSEQDTPHLWAPSEGNRRLAFLAGIVVFFSWLTPGLHAQQTSATPAEQTEPATDRPEAPKKVDVQPVARDEQIAMRLEDILTATEWFLRPNVEVRDGVVFLRGEASEEDYRAWATDLAQNTQDVAAVVNRMTVTQRSPWDLRPAIAELQQLAYYAIQNSPLIVFGLIVIALTWFFARLVRAAASWFFQRRIENLLLRRVVAQATMLPVLLLGVYIVLRVSGLTQLALTVLGGTGIAGLIIGIAFRDIAENFLASILISVQNPFRSGDLVQVADYTGFVQRVSTRGTVLMTFDGNHVQVSNAIIYKSTLVNFSANPNRRVEFLVGIGYDDSVSRAQEVIKAVVDKHPGVLNDPESRVILDELGASTVNLRVRVWLNAAENNPDVVRSSVMRMVKQALLQEGISLPDEAREVIFPNQVPVRMISDSDEAASSSQQPSDASSAEAAALTEEVLSVGEGDLRSEVEELQRQADQSWSPEEGTNLLKPDESALSTTS